MAESERSHRANTVKGVSMNPEEEAMEILMMFGREGCTIADSGGKDSSVLKRIAEKCREKYGLQYKIVHNHTGIDAPETVYFVRDEQKRASAMGIDYTINYPKITFDRLCVKKGMLPTRIARFCCEELKENYGSRDEKLVTGVRKSESTNRKNNQGVVTIMKKGGIPEDVMNSPDFTQTPRGGVVLLNYDNDESVEMVYTCFRTNRVLVNPLIYWTDDDVWRYIRDEKIPMNPLYEKGFNRVGCIGCPMADRRRRREFEMYPKYRERFIRIADRIVENMKAKKGDAYNGAETGLKYFKRWMEDPNIDGQFSFDENGNITEDYT